MAALSADEECDGEGKGEDDAVNRSLGKLERMMLRGVTRDSLLRQSERNQSCG